MNVRRIHGYTVPWNLAVAFFALSAVVASWAAYDPEAARAKLAILFIGIALYYAVVLLRGNGRTVLVEALAYGAGLLSIWFLLSHNWEVGGVDFEWIGRVGVGLTQLQLEGLQLGMHPNRAAGILAMMIPLQVATVALTHARAAWPRFGGAVLATLVSLFGLVMTSSRGAWVALGISTVILASLFMGRRVLLRFIWARKPLARWGIAMIAVVFLGIVLFCAPWSFMLEQLAAVPGETSIPDRLQLYRQAFEIAREVPIAGGGLASFAGLYSQYILVIPVYFLGYSHNLYLDVFLEQGLLGMATFLVVWLGSLGILLRRVVARRGADRASRILAWAVLGGVIISLLHGLVDDPLYGERGTPLLFLLPGLAVGLAASGPHRGVEGVPETGGLLRIRGRGRTVAAMLGGALLAVAGIGMFHFWPQIASAWHANIGVLSMAKAELAAWPAEGWQDERDERLMNQAEFSFRRALSFWPDQPAALYHLGLIELGRREFGPAAGHLLRALAARPSHQGIRKNLGYALAWAGEEARSREILRNFPEASEEMRHYSHWWKHEGRADLAAIATRMEIALRVSP